MKNVRTSSLAPDRPTAAKDCRLCNRRRIKCDRSVPSCKKCAVRQLECPGYGLRIQWEQGIASRGKLVGKRFPTEEDLGTSNDSQHEAALKTTALSTAVKDGKPKHISRCLQERQISALYRTPIGEMQSELERIHSFRALPPSLRYKAVGLFEYYDHVVAALMPWADGPNNKWRVAIIPLAMETPSLLFAILALSAEHHSKRISPNTAAEASHVSYYRDRSLTLLARELKREVETNSRDRRSDSRNGVLASILMLCQLEMIQTNASLWHVHWGAAKTTAANWTATIQDPNAMDETCRFLVKEAFVFDVFASFTTFDCEDYVSPSLIQGNNTDVFLDYLRLVQQVTQAERASHHGVVISHLFADAESLRKAFESTRQRNLELRRHMKFKTEAQVDDFDTLIDIFHYAGMVYSSEALQLAISEVRIKQDCSQLVDNINRIRDWGAFHHDLVWPIFILGTQARQLPQYQHFTETRLRQAMESTGFGNCYPALEFLQRFWLTKSADVQDWLAYARQESQRGVRFLVI